MGARLSARPGLVTRFALVSFVLIAGLGLVLGVFLQRALRDRTVADARRTGEVASNLGVSPLFTPEDLLRDFVPLDSERVAELDARLSTALSENGVVRIKVWNRQHWIVYSDNPELRGRWFASSDLLDQSFAGEVVSEITDLSAPEEREERDFGTLLAVYVPLAVDADGAFTTSRAESVEVIGAFEIYLPYEPIAAAIRTDRNRLFTVLGAGLVMLYLSLFRIVFGASRRLRRQAEENLHQATHDQLTELGNRSFLALRLAEELATRHDLATRTVSLVLFDIDGFRLMNETLGHRFGDEVLRRVAAVLLTQQRDGESVVRFGGDEFGMIVHHHPGDDVVARARVIAQKVENDPSIRALSVHVGLSAGVATAPQHGDDPLELVQHADVALNSAKDAHAGVEQYDPVENERSEERLALVGEVKRALAEGEIVLHFQPKFDLAESRIDAVEALIRWEHPERGLLLPFAFMPALESTDLIRAVTDRVLDLAIAQCRVWFDAGRSLRMAVNLSARDLVDADLPTRIARLLRHHQVPASMLECELTETALLDRPERAANILSRLHDLGVTIAIDDFGTGYASLAYLTALPVDVLKIDRSFVAQLAEQGSGAAIVGFTHDLARSLHLAVVGEGVETHTELTALRALGCDHIQGYLLTRPLPAADLDVWMDAFDPRSLWDPADDRSDLAVPELETTTP